MLHRCIIKSAAFCLYAERNGMFLNLMRLRGPGRFNPRNNYLAGHNPIDENGHSAFSHV